jgi:hypothetical protein
MSDRRFLFNICWETFVDRYLDQLTPSMHSTYSQTELRRDSWLRRDKVG